MKREYNQLRSLRDVIDLEAKAFMGAAVGLRSLDEIIERDVAGKKTEVVRSDDLKKLITPQLERLEKELGKIGARSALTAIHRLLAASKAEPPILTYQLLQEKLRDIESRFVDHLDFIKLFALNEQESALFEPAENLMAFEGKPIPGFTAAYPNAAFEIEEGAKCFALGRHTASVFHCMRTLEYGIKALAKLLGIPDPIKAADRNWAKILGNISDAIEVKFPKGGRLPHSQGAKLESLYSHLDAVRNPWRNAVMHVESVYAPHEALHIIRCTGFFMLELAKHCDEEGKDLSVLQ